MVRDRLCKPAGKEASIERQVQRWLAGLPKGGSKETVREFLGSLFIRLAEVRGLDTESRAATVRERGGSLPNGRGSLHDPAAVHLSPADLGRVYEQLLGKTASRKAAGIYFTPEPIVRVVVETTVGRMLAEMTPDQVETLTILDPACGCGAFLLDAYECLRSWYEEHTDLSPDAIRKRILLAHLYGVDRDPLAVEVTRLSLILQSAAGVPDLSGNIRCGDALLGPERSEDGLDWEAAFPTVLRRGGFSVVLGNPPWGQKEINADPEMKRYLAEQYPSSAGIHDLFRPFVERGVQLTAPGSRFGMVLPDIVLLKDYPQTRRYLLDQLALERIDWWGRAFAQATIDTVSIVGRKGPAPAGHAVAVQIHDQPPLAHTIPQADFLNNPRFVFNLHLIPSRRRFLDHLADCPRLGDLFEIHEGVHSGNIRAELFVPDAVDGSCRPLLFGRDEITPYRLRWQGRYLRLAALPVRKTRERYANLGRPEWHERSKLLVRRTGDFLLAAVDAEGRYVSNNFFLVFPRRPCALDLDGLCALLNSRWMTAYFRTIEPRQGRVFAELKIKHLRVLPLPHAVLEHDGCGAINELGARRRHDEKLDQEIEECTRQLFGTNESAID